MATTQLSEAYAIQKTKAGAEKSPDISEGKKYVRVVDTNAGSYNSGIVEIDATNALIGSQGWQDLGDAYITVPVAITAQINGILPTDAKQFPRFLVAPKAGITNWVDSLSVELNGQTIVNEGSYKWHHANLRALLQTSESELKKHGDERFLSGGVDNWNSLGWGTIKTTSGGTTTSQGTVFGDAFHNNRTDDTSTTDRTDLQNAPNTLYNNAFFQRMARLTPIGVNEATQTQSPFNWPSLGKASGTKAILRRNAKGAWQEYPKPSAAGAIIGEWFIPLHIRLRDLHDVFDKIPLCQNAQLKIRMKINTGSFTVAYGSGGTMNLESVNVLGSVVPVMLNNYLEVGKNSENQTMTVEGSKITVYFGPCGNDLTTRERVGEYLPYNRCYLNVPFYQLSPQAESSLLSKPVHRVEFEDSYVQLFRDQAGSGIQDTPINAEFNLMVGGSHKRTKYVAVFPWANTSKDYWVSPTLKAEQWQSPFDAAPFSNCLPGGQISNFQVLVGNEPIFPKSVEYDEEMYKHEVSKIYALNGDRSVVLNNGLLDSTTWANSNRFLIADCSRATTNNGDAPASIMISGANTCAMGMNLMAMVVTQKSFSLDIVSGDVSDVQI